MNQERKDVRVTLMMSESEVEAVDDWGFAHRIRTRAEAIRQLIELGLKEADASRELKERGLVSAEEPGSDGMFDD